jgi:hypothetical protein
MTEGSESGWIGYAADDPHGRPAVEGNEHLSVEQRADLERRATEVGGARGHHQAVVVVDVYENGEAVPQVQFPKDSTVEPRDQTQVNSVVAKAAEALNNWR